jgi:hypothetical protein
MNKLIPKMKELELNRRRPWEVEATVSLEVGENIIDEMVTVRRCHNILNKCSFKIERKSDKISTIEDIVGIDWNRVKFAAARIMAKHEKEEKERERILKTERYNNEKIFDIVDMVHLPSEYKVKTSTLEDYMKWSAPSVEFTTEVKGNLGGSTTVTYRVRKSYDLGKRDWFEVSEGCSQIGRSVKTLDKIAKKIEDHYIEMRDELDRETLRKQKADTRANKYKEIFGDIFTTDYSGNFYPAVNRVSIMANVDFTEFSYGPFNNLTADEVKAIMKIVIKDEN